MRMVQAGILSVLLLSTVQAADYIWIEGEKPAFGNYQAVKEVKMGGWGHKQYLSEDTWLNVMLNEKDVEQAIPKEGLTIGYDFEAPKAGKYDVWGRIGYEFVRSPFKWRIDGGEWQTVTSENLTTDLMDLEVWCEVAWLQWGVADLAAGKHKLEIQLEVTKGKDKAGKETVQNLLFACDAICLSPVPFRPNGKFKPDQSGLDETDQKAGRQTFEIKAGAAPAERVETPLSGTWQIARWDEGEIKDRTEPIASLPQSEELVWKAIAVPGDRNVVRPDMLMAHRYFYRTQVKVPADMKGRSFFLHFPAVNMIASVFVNGQFCGSTKAPLAVWDCDITKAVKPGAVNEIQVGIKDTYYGIATQTRRNFNTPLEWMRHNQGVSQRLDFAVWSKLQNGILEPPVLVSSGSVYTADVFAKPSVKKKELGLEITVKNPGTTEATVTVANEVLPLAGGATEKKFAPKEVKIAPGAEAVVQLAEEWANPKLWWPDDPQQYLVVTTLSQNGQVLDTAKTKFGFREWTWTDGLQFKLNGIPWQGRADLTGLNTQDSAKALADWQKHGQTMFRFWNTAWAGLDQVQTLDYMDAHGVPVRRSGIFDGELASYGLNETVKGPDGKDQRIARKALFDNWRTQMLAHVKGERNHPSVFIWSLENEVIFINASLSNQLSYVEPEIREVAKAVMALDPTRPVMVDGGQALMDQSLPVYGCHYTEAPMREYPDEAYTLAKFYNATEKKRVGWPTTPDRPAFFGETFFARGYNPGWFSQVGGESAFLGRSECSRPCGLLAKMQSEGYRWAGLAAFHFWFGDGDATLHYNAWQPVCVLCRQWNWTFGGGTTVERTLKVLNDTRYSDPIEMAWQFKLDGKVIQEDKKAYTVAPGTGQEVALKLQVPAVKDRTRGEFILTCARGGKEVFREVKDVWVIDPNGAPKPKLAKADLVVLDPKGAVKSRLMARGIEYVEAAQVADIPATAKVVIVGPDALSAREATDNKWLTLAAEGARILVLDQTEPLRYQAIPADLEPTALAGRIAFAENLEHPIFQGLDQSDFFTWSGDHIVYRNVYKKASHGAKSLAQCDDELTCSAVAECPVNNGVLLLCQLVAGSKLTSDPVAQRLFDNMLNYLAGYQVVQKATAVAMDENSPAGKLLAGSGLKYDKAADVVGAIGDGKHEIVIAEANPANLKALAAARDKLKTFTDKGGYLMLWGLTPEGLADFNQIVGVPHLLRPFEMERVTLATPRDPLTSGLTMPSVVMESGEKIATHAGDRFGANDVFSGVVDLEDIAPFASLPGPEYWGNPGEKPGFDHWPRNMVNGYVLADSWKYCFMIILNKKDKAGNPTPEPAKWTMELPRAEEICEFSIAINCSYHKITKINLYFDDDKTPVTLETRPVAERQDFPLNPPRKCKKLTVDLVAWEKSGTQDVIGVDNLWIRVKRPTDFAQKVRPMLNIGALVRYPMGPGGVILNQLQIPTSEAVPINALKKQTIVATILRNLGAVYAGGKTVSTANLKFEPIPLEDQCNQYLTSDRGWFDSKVEKYDLANLPGGENKFGGVPFVIRDFKTSPLPSCVMLAGTGVKGKLPKEVLGLKVEKKADRLYFLHTARAVNPWRGRAGQALPTVFKYVVNYADGQKAEIPVILGEGVDNWITKDPHGLKSAALAWSAAPAGAQPGEQAVLYEMEWVNPRPETPIKSVDLKYDEKIGGQYFVPALLAITAGTQTK